MKIPLFPIMSNIDSSIRLKQKLDFANLFETDLSLSDDKRLSIYTFYEKINLP